FMVMAAAFQSPAADSAALALLPSGRRSVHELPSADRECSRPSAERTIAVKFASGSAGKRPRGLLAPQSAWAEGTVVGRALLLPLIWISSASVSVHWPDALRMTTRNCAPAAAGARMLTISKDRVKWPRPMMSSEWRAPTRIY